MKKCVLSLILGLCLVISPVSTAIVSAAAIDEPTPYYTYMNGFEPYGEKVNSSVLRYGIEVMGTSNVVKMTGSVRIEKGNSDGSRTFMGSFNFNANSNYYSNSELVSSLGVAIYFITANITVTTSGGKTESDTTQRMLYVGSLT